MSTGNAHEDPTHLRSCRQVLRVLQSYLDGALGDTAAGRVAEHLEGCRRCVLEAETYEAIKDALARRGPIPPTAVRRLHEFGQALLNEADESAPKQGSLGG